MNAYTKRTLSLAMAVFFGMTAITGCQKTSETLSTETAGVTELSPQAAKETATADQTMGRYLEEEASLPEEAAYLLDIARQKNGNIRCAGLTTEGSLGVWDSADGKNWTTAYTVSKEHLDSREIGLISISPTGTAFCSTNDYTDESVGLAYWFVDETGTVKNIPIQLNEDGASLYRADFSESGKLILYFYSGMICEADPATGTLGKNMNPDGALAHGFFCIGDKVFLMTETGTSFYDLEKKETETVSEVLEKQLDSYISEGVGYSASSPFVLSEGTDGTLFFASQDGIFSYLNGGTVTEQIVDGSLCSLSSPSMGNISLCAMDDGSFYFLGIGDDGAAKLYHYAYSADAPTKPNVELKLYTMSENKNLQQLAVQFQKEHPDVYVHIQTGRSGDDAVTASDALRSLSTDIMAGKGPDILILDELPLESYAEKGLLADLSDIVEEIESSEGFLGNMEQAFLEENGEIYAIPAKFQIPMIFGPKELTEKVTDFSTLVSTAKEAKASYPDYQSVLGILPPVYLAESLYDVCSAFWVQEDGSIDAQAVETFYEGLLDMYQLDTAFQESYEDYFAVQKDSLEEMRSYGLVGTFTPISVLSKLNVFSFGMMKDLYNYAEITSAETLKEEYRAELMNGQSSNTYVPKEIYGINSKSAILDVAKEFLAFALSSANQSGAYDDFPTNQKSFEKLLSSNTEFNASSSFAGSEGEEIALDIVFPSEENVKRLKTMAESLTTPAFVNAVVREAVIGNADACLEGQITPKQAAQDALQKVNLYLSE